MQRIVRKNVVARDMGGYDALVFGGGLAGWAAALSLARADRGVLLAAPRTSLGHEVWAAMSTWWPADLDTPDLWAEVVGELERVNAARGSLVDPVATQVALEASAEEAGVELLLQVNAHPGEGGVTQLTGRWGLMAARSRLVIDATTDARLAIEAGAQTRVRESDEPLIRRALMVKTGLSEPERIEVGEDLPLTDGSVMAWTGLWPGDVILEAQLDLSADDSSAREMQSRRAIAEIAIRLRQAREDFRQGSLTSIAHDPIHPRDRVLAPGRDAAVIAELRGEEAAYPVTRGMMLPEGADGLIVASPALDLGEITARTCYHAPNAVTLGVAAASIGAEILDGGAPK